MRIRIPIALACLAAALAAAGAGAATIVYSNDFDRRAQVKQLKKVSGGKDCKRSWRRGNRQLGFRVTAARTDCAFRTPLVAETAQSPQQISAQLRITKRTAKSVAKRAYVGLRVRGDRRGGYELRVYPHQRRVKLIRRPGGAGFPVNEVNRGAVKRFPKANQLMLRVRGDRVTARVNKTRVAQVTDPASLGAAGGRQAMVLFGNTRRIDKDVVGWLDKVRGGIP